MKKLMGILSSLSMIAIATSNVVACGSNKYDKKDDDGNSILIDGMGGLNFNDGKSYIDTSDMLNKIIENGGDSALRGKLINRFINLLSASFMAKAANTSTKSDEWFGDVKNNPYLNQGLVNKMSQSYTEVKVAAENAMKTERDSYKDQYGKKWETKWTSMLKDKFPGFEDLDELENKYVVYQMINGDDNINTRLLDILLKTDQMGIEWISSGTVKGYYDTVKNIYNNDDANYTKLTAWISDNTSKAKQLVWGFKTGPGVKDNCYLNMDESTILANIKTIMSDSATYKREKIKDAPDNIDSISENSSKSDAVSGFLSNSQRFFLDKYYEREAPIAISRITIPFDTNGKMDDGIQKEDFIGKTKEDWTPDQKNKYADYDAFLGDLNNNWNSLLAGQTFSNITKTDSSTLLTLSASTDTYSQMLKNVVYNFVKDSSKKETSATSFESLVDGIESGANRSASENMYINLGNGILAFVDSSGLELVRIEGYKLLEEAVSASNSGVIGNETTTDNEGNTTTSINTNTLTELSYFKDFANETEAEKINSIQNYGGYSSSSVSASGDGLYENLNKEVSNPYLHFLVNQSLLHGVTGSYTSFDIMTEVNSYVSISEPSSSSSYTFWTAIIDYIFEIEKSNNKSSTFEFDDFINEYIIVGSSEKDTDYADSKKLFDFCVGGVKTVQITEKNDNFESFISAQEKENNTITQNTTKGYPTGVFGKFEETVFQDFVTGKWTPYKTTTSLKSYDYSSLNIESYYLGYARGIK